MKSLLIDQVHMRSLYLDLQLMNKLLIEQGAMCARQPYQHKSDLRFPHAMNGYAVIYQDYEGNTCFNKSHVVYLGSQLPPKKEILYGVLEIIITIFY